MAFHSGRDGSLYVDWIRLARVAGWSLSGGVETLEVTNLGDNERNYIPGLKSAQGSATIFYHDDAPVSLLAKIFKTGATAEADKVRLSLRFGTKKVDFDAYINTAEFSCQVGSVMQAAISFTVTGDYQALEL